MMLIQKKTTNEIAKLWFEIEFIEAWHMLRILTDQSFANFEDFAPQNNAAIRLE